MRVKRVVPDLVYFSHAGSNFERLALNLDGTYCTAE